MLPSNPSKLPGEVKMETHEDIQPKKMRALGKKSLLFNGLALLFLSCGFTLAYTETGASLLTFVLLSLGGLFLIVGLITESLRTYRKHRQHPTFYSEIHFWVMVFVSVIVIAYHVLALVMGLFGW